MWFKEARCFVFIVGAIFVYSIQATPVANSEPSQWFGDSLDIHQDINNLQGTQLRYRNSYSDGSYGIFKHQVFSNVEEKPVVVSYSVFNANGDLTFSKEKSYPLSSGGEDEISSSIEQYKTAINQQERKADEAKSGTGNFAEFKDRVDYTIDQPEGVTGTNRLVIHSEVFENHNLKLSKTKLITLARGSDDILSVIERILEKNKSLIRVGPKKKKSKGKKENKVGEENHQVARTTALSVSFSSSTADGGVTSIKATCKTYVNGSRVKKFTVDYTANNQQEITGIKTNFKTKVCK